MTDFHKALNGFWAQFGMPIFLTGHVPKEQEPPYITMDIVEGAALCTSSLTATGWFNASGQEADAQRTAFLEAVRLAIPPGGIKLTKGSMAALLYPNNENFLSYCYNPNDDTVTGGKVTYDVRYLTY